MKWRSATERPEDSLVARLDEVAMTPGERRDALHALRVGSWLADLLVTTGDRARGLGRAVMVRHIRRKRAGRKQAARGAATRRPARA
jgi:hypothetical protein